MTFLKQTWRWFGASDPTSLHEIKQSGATGIVTALYHIPCGEIWTTDEIDDCRKQIEKAGLSWSVVESVNIHESIKTASSERGAFIAKYQQTLRNLAASGIKTVCYNFMPVLDWTRTDLSYKVADGSYALRYDATALAGFDLYILKRAGAEEDYSEEQKKKAYDFIKSLASSQKNYLQQTIMAGLPGTDEVFSLEEFRRHLKVYEQIDSTQLKENLAYFLQQIIPVAEEHGIKMCIHPDDPPFPILGLPRIVSTEKDLNDVLQAIDSDCNGITFCTGSLGARGDNDLPGMIQRLGARIHFFHLRNVQRLPDGSFYEADHLDGSVDMYAVMQAAIAEQERRAVNAGDEDVRIPMRPDHGHQLAFDSGEQYYPGYSAVGRLKGLGELRGLELGIKGALSTST
ncbi:mannonate dehydratase [Fulvivirgaceae bacterium BMA12]|uniref:Mannonate dehydratase n=1 Tax=Agaribacillus aureus TaxID=3051825 RepID=A0ABT8L3V3_9BACT|nr:mannonate dehydratase [Fulvivirgaceae bacterium BMA12]